jgi:hypothetical protein
MCRLVRSSVSTTDDCPDRPVRNLGGSRDIALW